MFEIGEVLGDALRIESVLGRGGSGTVYLASDLWLARKVAVKALMGPLASDARAVSQFRTEAQALARVRSEHVAQAYGMGSKDGACWLAMEYIEGSSLATIMRDHAANRALVPAARALSILRQAASGLAAVHRAGLVHRDVKPANIVVERGTGRPVLVDFGLAMAEGERAPPDGTAAYMAPEQADAFGDNDRLTGKADIYSLGVTAFELLTGRLPYQGRTPLEMLVKHALDEPPLVSEFRSGLAPVDEVVAKALAKDPAHRHASADALVVALEDALIAIDRRPTYPPLVTVAELSDAPRVLIVDDDPAFRRFATMLLREALPNVQVLDAPDGETALSIAYQATPDLVLLDFDMPGIDGIETLTELRRLPRGNDARVLVVSGTATAQDQWRFSVLGVTDFLKKPTAPEELVATVSRLVD
jgi:serine/threonine-protein kinase